MLEIDNKAFMGYKFINPSASDEQIIDKLRKTDKLVLNELSKVGERYLKCLASKTTAF